MIYLICNGIRVMFDGDCLNILYVPNREFCRVADMTFNPRKTMVISANDGKFNNQMNLFKDILITANGIISLGRKAYTEEELAMIKACKNDVS